MTGATIRGMVIKLTNYGATRVIQRPSEAITIQVSGPMANMDI